MKKLILTSIFLLFFALLPTVRSSTVLICKYSTGAEIVVDIKDFNGTKIDIKRVSPQKMMTHKIHIENKTNFSEVDDYLEVEAKGHKHTYALTCERR